MSWVTICFMAPWSLNSSEDIHLLVKDDAQCRHLTFLLLAPVGALPDGHLKHKLGVPWA